MIENVIISDRYLNEIKKAIGYPTINDEFSSMGIDETYIKEMVIAPAMEEYFTYFPKLEKAKVSVGGQSPTSIDMPSNYLGIIYSQLLGQNQTTNGLGSSPTSALYDKIGADIGGVIPFGGLGQNIQAGNGLYGTGLNYGVNASLGMQMQMLNNGFTKKGFGFRVQPNFDTNKIDIYSTKQGVVEVWIGLYSSDFNTAIEMKYRPYMIKFCQGKLLENIAEILKFETSDLPSSFDQGTIDDRASDLIEEAVTYFREVSSVISQTG